MLIQIAREQRGLVHHEAAQLGENSPFHSHLSLIAVRIVRRNFTAHLPSLYLFCGADEILSPRPQQG